MIDILLDIFPLFGWITILIVGIALVAPRVSDAARQARTEARTSLLWLTVPALLNWACSSSLPVG